VIGAFDGGDTQASAAQFADEVFHQRGFAGTGVADDIEHRWSFA
jgi:hypothetical protein